MQRLSSFVGVACVVTLVLATLLSVASAENCGLVGKWRSYDNSEHYHINITFDFQSDSTYQANATTADFECKCSVSETGVWRQPSASTLSIKAKTCQASECCGCEEEELNYNIKFTSNCKVVFFILPDHGTIDFRRI